MKPLSVSEIRIFVEKLKEFYGAQLQEIATSPLGLSLAHYVQSEGGRGQMIWIHFDMNQNLPMIQVDHSAPSEKKKTKSPVQLFLTAHARGRRLSKIEMDASVGRGLILEWGNPEEATNPLCRAEVRLIPTKANILVSCGASSLSWKKLDALPSAPSGNVPENPRTIEAISSEWNALRSEKSAEGGVRPEVLANRAREKYAKEIEKKTTALQKMTERLGAIDPRPLSDAADWIRDHWSLDLPDDLKRSLPDALKEQVLNSADPQLLPKILGEFYEHLKHAKVVYEKQLQRIDVLRQELKKIQAVLSQSDVELAGNLKSPRKIALELKSSSGKKLQLTDSEFVVVGRSAAENLQILRDAQPWDLWIHLKDLPSAHGVLRRHRGKSVSDEKLVLAFHFVLKMTPKVARHLQAGDRVEGIVAECRYVIPLKGDKLGRVTVRESRTLQMRYDPAQFPMEK